MADDDESHQDSPERIAPSDPFATIDRAMAEILADFQALAAALDAASCEQIEIAATRLVDAWLLVDAMVELFEAPTAEARKQLRIARHALWTAGQVVDELFACAVARSEGAPRAFIAQIRATVAFVLDSGDLPGVHEGALC